MKVKKFFLSLIALFVMGEMCNAQTLLSGQNLNRRDIYDITARSLKTDPTPQSRSADAADATTYFVVSSAYDIYGTFHPEPEARNYSGYPLRIEMPADGMSGEVTITGLYDFGKYEDVTLTPVTGTYDAAAATITIPTPFDQRYESKCIKVGTYTRGDNVFRGVVAACSVGSQPDMSGQYPINVLDELVFDIAADGTLTPRSSWLIYSFGGLQNGIENLFNCTLGKPITEQASILAVPAEVKFPDGTVYAGTQAAEPLYIVNTGRKSAGCQYNVNGNGLQLSGYPSVDGLTFNTFCVYLTAPNEGEYTGNIDIAYNGQSINIPVKAIVMKANDYNEIVKNGDFTFSLTTGDYVYEPWIVTDGIIVHPVALASCKVNESCGLNIEMNVPEGKIGLFSWKGITETMMPNGFRVILDESDIVYDNTYSWSGYNAPHPADGYIVVPEGEHILTFEYLHLMDWYNMGIADAPQRAYIWDLDLQTYDKEDNLGVLMDQTVDFGTWYLDKFICGATAEASILNLGNNVLEVTGGENSQSFEVTGIGRQVDTMRDLKALISFNGDRLGDYDEIVTVKTNGGDFKVRCVAKAIKIINDYQYLVSEGDLSFGTSVSHPFTADTKNKTAYSSTAKLEPSNDDPDPDSWLSASFIVPEGKIGTLTWEAFNSSNDYYNWMGDLTFTDGTQIYIDGEQVAEFVGICEASSLDIDESYLSLPAGKHNIIFNYVRKSSRSEGNDDRFVINNIGLKMTQAGVESTDIDITPVSEIFYTVDGLPVAEPSNGLFIKRTEFSDGTVKTVKLIKR